MVFIATFYNISVISRGKIDTPNAYIHYRSFSLHGIPTNVISSNTAHSNVYSIQHYVIKFVSDL
jgi:hypothetical protein